MRILIKGAGICGCALARLLSDRGAVVRIVEKAERIGGLCVTDVSADGVQYEPYGARTFHTDQSRVWQFAGRFGEFSDYVHRKGMIVDGRLLPFPMTLAAIDSLGPAATIRAELDRRPAKPDESNFETACRSLFGETLYRMFIENYTRKMWGLEPARLTADWAPKRLEFRQDSSAGLFGSEWQGLPLQGYSAWLENMVAGIPVEVGRHAPDESGFDLVVSSARLDESLDYRFGALQYRCVEFDLRRDEDWEEPAFGTINLPQDDWFFRKCNFNVLHQQLDRRSLIQYQRAVACGPDQMPMYPLTTRENEARFQQYLEEACRRSTFCPAGRLGLFKYLDMDEAIDAAFCLADLVADYPRLTATERVAAISRIRSRYA